MSKPRKQTTTADMSLPAEERAKGRKPGRVATPPGVMAHGTNPRARRHRRDGERWLAAEERARQAYEDDCGAAGLWQDMPQDEPGWDVVHDALAEAARRGGT